jgi:hypothetical protein
MSKNKETLYYCSDCKYKTQKKYNFYCHMKSKKHHQNVVKCCDDNDDDDNDDDENNIYLCEICNYSTNLYSNFTKHLNTQKHIMKNKSKDNETKIENESSGLKLTEDVFQELVKSNKQLMEVIQNGTNNIANINSNNTNNANTFNLNFFLNETCKDAINFKDFIESIEVSIMDLKKLGNKGYVEGISSLMIDKLNELDITKRPIHSTDVKRNSIYIKDDDEWEKDEKGKLISTLWDVARLETRALENKYKTEYPKCETDRNSREHEEYWRIFYNAMGGKDGDIEDLQKKVIKKIVQHVAIDKTKLY